MLSASCGNEIDADSDTSENDLLSTEPLCLQFNGVQYALELPAPFVATTTNLPKALGLVVRATKAVAPVGSTVTDPTLTAVGLKAGRNENVAPIRFAPLTITDEAVF